MLERRRANAAEDAAFSRRWTTSKSPFSFSFSGGRVFSTQPPARHVQWAVEHPDAAWPDPHGITALIARLRAGGQCAMIGKRGCGKTQFAAWLHTGWGPVVGYFRASDLFNMMRSWFDLPGDQSQSNTNLLYRCPLLIIDEIQDRNETEHEDKLLTNLVDHRYGDRMPTLLMGNLTLDTFAENVGTSIASRIQEDGVVLSCNWSSYRGAKP